MSRATENHSTLEHVPKAEVSSSYIYSVPDDSPLQVNQDQYNQDIPWTSTQPLEPAPDLAPAKRPSPFLRWPFLVLYAILIAILAGLGGGFIGEDITTKRLEKDTVARSDLSQVCDTISNQSANPSPSSIPPSISPPIPSSTATPTLFQRTIPVPTTGCTPPDQQRSFKSISNFLGVTYTTYCATGWMSNELFAMSAASPSDCVEACVMYNGHKGTADRTCVGGGYIPAWWNQSKAMDESGGMPYNCFLKSSDAGTGRNEKSVEIVSLCLDGACKDVLGGR